MRKAKSTFRASRANRKGRTWFLGLLVVALAGLMIAGPRLFAQAPGTPMHAQTAAVAGEHGGEAIQLPFGDEAWLPLFIVLGGALVALAFGAYWWMKTMKASPGSERMQGVASAVQEGAMAYLARQVKTMAPVVLVLGIGLFFLYRSQYAFMGDETAVVLGLGVSVAFLLGVTASYLAGYVGMGVAATCAWPTRPFRVSRARSKSPFRPAR
jgi:hypothetical protein